MIKAIVFWCLLLVAQPAGALFVTFTGDSAWTGDEILVDSAGVAHASQSSICWGWYDNDDISETPDWQDGACDASTDADGRLTAITITTGLSAGQTGLLLLKLGTRIGAYFMTVQE